MVRVTGMSLNALGGTVDSRRWYASTTGTVVSNSTASLAGQHP